RTQRGIAERVGLHFEAAGDMVAALDPLFAAAWERFEASEYAAALAALDRRDRAMDALDLPADDPRRAWGSLRRALVLARTGAARAAAPLVDRAEAVARAHALADLLAEALHARAKNAQMAGEATLAIALFQEARARFIEVRDRGGVARCDHGEAEMLKQT